MKTLFASLLAASLLGAAPARAQEIGPALDMTLMTGWTGGAAVQYDLEKRAGLAHNTAGTNPSKTANTLTYQPTAALEQQTVQRLANKLQASRPAGAQAVQAAFGPGKASYGQLYRDATKTTPYAPNDAAAAMAAYLELGYQVVNNITSATAITPTQERGLRTQAAGILGQNAALGSAAAVARLGEELKLQTVVLLLGWQQSQKNGQAVTFRQQIAAQFRQQYGLDMSQLRVTNAGFAKK